MNTEQRIARFREETKNISRETSILFWIFGIATIALLLTSFIVPPTGIIDPTVLKAGAIFFAFATLAEAREAIREGLGVKLTHGHTTIEVHDLDGKPGDENGPGHGQPQYEPETDLEDENN